MKKNRTTTMLVWVVVALAATVTIAHADPRDEADDFEFHLSGGMEATGGDGVFGGGFRGHVAVGKSFGTGRVRPQLTLGAVFGAGGLSVDDPRALSGTLNVSYASYGPEAQVGLKLANGGHVDSRIFAGLALMKVSMDDRLMLDFVPGLSDASTRGLRGSIGANWADRTIGTNRSCHDDCGLLMLFVPQQAELVWEHDANSNRYGFALAWGI